MAFFHGIAGQAVRVLCVYLIVVPSLVAGQSADLANVVPDDTLVYLGWAGRDHTKVAAKDTALGKTLADPQVRHFIEAVFAAVDTAIKERALSPQQHPLYENGKRILQTLHRRPTAFVLIDADMGEEGPSVNAAIISHVGQEAGAFLKKIDELLTSVGLLQAEQSAPSDGTFRQLPLPIPIGVFYGAVDEYFLLTVGQHTASVLTPCLRGDGKALSAGEAMMRSRAKIGGDDKTRAVSVFVDAAKIRERVEKLLPMFTGGNPDALAAYHVFMEGSGYGAIQSFGWEMHHKGGGCYNGAYIHTGQKPSGVLSAYATEPLTDKELALIPRDVNWAIGWRIGSTKWYDTILGFVLSIAPEEKDEILESIADAEEDLGFRLGDDFLNLINDSMIAFDAAEDGGLLFTGITVLFKSSDTARFQESLRKIVGLIAKEIEDDASIDIKRVDHRNHPIDFINVSGVPMPVAPAWSSHDGWIIMGLYPQMVRNTIDRLLDHDTQSDSILANADFVRARKEIGSMGAVMQFSNTKRGVEDMYAILLPLAQTGLAMAQSKGVPLDIGSFPSRKAVTQHLFSDLWTSRGDGEGILFSSYGPLPAPIPAFGGAGGVAVVALIISILLPSLSRARELSKRQVSAANLRGIGTACLIYANDNKEQFPPNLQTLVDAGDITPVELCPPGYTEVPDCYVYVPGQNAGSDARNILAHEPEGIHNGEGVNVLFVDGHVEFLRMPMFHEMLNETKERLERE